MLRYLIRRILWTFIVLLLVSLITFLIYFVLPPNNSVYESFTHGSLTATASRLTKHYLGLDRPFWVQYGLFAKHVFTGDQWGGPGCGSRSRPGRRSGRSSRARRRSRRSSRWALRDLAAARHPGGRGVGPSAPIPPGPRGHGDRPRGGVHPSVLPGPRLALRVLVQAAPGAGDRLRVARPRGLALVAADAAPVDGPGSAVRGVLRADGPGHPDGGARRGLRFERPGPRG